MSDEEIAKRMRQARGFADMGREKFAKLLGVGTSSWQKYEEDQAVPGGNVLKALCEQGYSVDWILTGKGEMLLSQVERGIILPFDMELMNQIIAEVDRRLEKKKRKVSSSKRAKLYGLLYEEIMTKRVEDKARGLEPETELDLEKVARFVELAV